MKIILIHHFPGVGGGTMSALDVVKMMKKMGHEVILAVPKPGQMIVNSCRDLGIELKNVEKPILYSYHNAGSNALRCYTKYLLSQKKAFYWRNFFKSENPDLVVLNSSVLAPLVPIINGLGIKSLVMVRETFRSQGFVWANNKLRNFINRADLVLYLTEFDRRQWNTNMDKSGILPDVVDEDRYLKHAKEEIAEFQHRNGIDGNIPYILYLGGIFSIKGALDILKAYKKITEGRKDLGLFILGGEGRQNVLSKILHRKEVAHRTSCRRLIDCMIGQGLPVKEIGITDDVSFYYESSSIVVFPVNVVHQPRPAYESGYYCLPIILPDYDNFKEYINHGVNGLLYDKGNSDDLCKNIQLLLDDNVKAVEIGRNNNQSYKKEHSFDVGMKTLKNYLVRLCNQ